jgi:hypothetical protein
MASAAIVIAYHSAVGGYVTICDDEACSGSLKNG